ncbi:stage II sporulation protein P [Pelotomaculum terephthalicicum JT]|uniref:stage II sporulation protein P n=1 Tax=Pelotomaculum TaxID=191373 RepID=UPI0009C56F9F|nr:MULTISPECIES: stage II sporulation protein P [Pelotomaculum]MCG9967028.1 stage II sporulation protein P [Pelotomaculum terephthalicicum JT]OPX90526.1 MAG: Stage II sporulation protein P (SpoIIP) [Pelotomaculum sp. PtaB.Bin117]OPY60062.1 MAG: Stage II sporulation protein P (SpoIIP) [Pelotomaculum sp. PtaU1.Bin065]
MYPVHAARFRYARIDHVCRFIALAGLLSMLLLLFSRITGAAALTALKETVDKIPEGVIAVFYQREPLKILQGALPVLCWSGFEEDSCSGSLSQSLLDSLGVVVRVDMSSPAAVLKSQMPVLVMSAPPGAVAVSRSGGAHPVDNAPAAQTSTLPGEILVIIYNTHTGETYSMTDRAERLDGRQGGIVTVAAALQETLESKYGIKVARSDRIHDADYNASYLESEKTLKEMLAANPEARVVFDIHRDAAKSREQSLVKINGENVAPLLFITGARMSSNYAFAAKLSAETNKMYPGLSLGVRVKTSNYNQYLHPHAVLVEIGTSKNSVEEAVRSAVLFADAVARVIMEESKVIS